MAFSDDPAILLAWADLDAARALHALDREVIRSTEAARSLVLDLFDRAAPARDLFNACARLGGLMAEAGASPSLAAQTIDCAEQALVAAKVSYDAARIGAARASVLEGFVAAIRDAERAQSMHAWEYPSCAVALADGTVAIACGFPSDDAEAIAGWAARAASRLSKEKVRRVVLSGPERARAELESAVELVGIRAGAPEPRAAHREEPRVVVADDVEEDAAETPRPASHAKEAPKNPAWGWLRLPWRK